MRYAACSPSQCSCVLSQPHDDNQRNPRQLTLDGSAHTVFPVSADRKLQGARQQHLPILFRFVMNYQQSIRGFWGRHVDLCVTKRCDG